MKKIVIKGAREHNLKNIDVEIPRDKLVVITGLSGSGKSSLAFDTIYAEGQRRYVESLSAYARQFLEQMRKPDVDSIEGLSPAISIEQKSGSRNPRSTVGTVTEIYDYLRLLWARVGSVPATAAASAIASQTHPADGRPASWSCPRGRASRCWRRWCAIARASTRPSSRSCARTASCAPTSTASSYELAEPPKLDKSKKHTIEVFVDRLVRKDGIRQRLTDSVELAAKLAEGVVKISPLEGGRTCSSPRGSPARPAASATRRSRRGCSRSTTRPAPARPATASARRCSSTPTSSSPTTSCRCRRGRSSRGSGATAPSSTGCSTRSPRTSGSTSTPRGASCRRRRGRC